MVEIRARISKVGNSYAVFIPKPLIDCKVLPVGQEIVLHVAGALPSDTFDEMIAQEVLEEANVKRGLRNKKLKNLYSAGNASGPYCSPLIPDPKDPPGNPDIAMAWA